jgi:23S rRNA pseudouridine1911/1915/1917 synthase
MNPTEARSETITVDPAEAGARLDLFLTRRLAGFSRSRVQALIRAGSVSKSGETVEAARERVKLGEVYTVIVPGVRPTVLQPETIALSIVYEDDHLVVIDKPKGMVVHPGAGHETGTLVNALMAHCGDSLSGVGGVKRPGIVHRLDKGTTGLLVVAKNDLAHRRLAEQFARHGADGQLVRSYLALCWGVPERRRGRIEAPLGRDQLNRTKFSVIRNGRRAVTLYEVIETFTAHEGKPLASLVRLTLATGRTHQIRVHLAHIGNPLLGDQGYGSGFAASARRLDPEARAALVALGRPALHAAVLGFAHPGTGEQMSFASPLPADLAELVEMLRGAPQRPRSRD